MNFDIVDVLRSYHESGCTCGSLEYSRCTCDDSIWPEMFIDAAADEIEKLRSLIKELLPFMINDMEQGISLGYVEEHKEDTPCPDCQWYNDSMLWKNRLDAGEFKDYGN